MDPITMAALMQASGSAANLLFGKNPANEAMKYAGKVGETVSPYYKPYIGAGQRSLNTLEQQYNQLINNPQAIMQMLGGSFEQSPGYQFQYDQAMNASNNASAAGGMLGSPAHQQQSATLATNLANQDYYNYLGHMQNLYGTGLEGYQGLNAMGYNASDALAGYLAQELMAQAGIAAKAAQYRNQSIGGLFGGLAGLGSSFLSPVESALDPITGLF